MPFVTEEIFQLLKPRQEDLCVKQFPPIGNINTDILSNAVLLKDVITGLRDVRNKQQLKPKETIELFIDSSNNKTYSQIENILAKQVNAASISFTTAQVADAISCVIGKDKFYIKTERPVDSGQQRTDL